MGKLKSVPPVNTPDIQDDWERRLTSDEIDDRMKRVAGDFICPKCGNKYYDHPMETRIKDWEGRPFLNRLCNGWFGKL